MGLIESQLGSEPAPAHSFIDKFILTPMNKCAGHSEKSKVAASPNLLPNKNILSSDGSKPTYWLPIYLPSNPLRVLQTTLQS